jgi:tetratricopeptide (TPR) repeat protein
LCTSVRCGMTSLNLIGARRALNRREFEEAEWRLRGAIDQDPQCAEAHNLLGLLHESLGEYHAAYRSYKSALLAERDYEPALGNMRRYCDRFGFDFHNEAINPGAGSERAVHSAAGTSGGQARRQTSASNAWRIDTGERPTREELRHRSRIFKRDDPLI